jgi:D-lactate dehydrogenase
MRQERITEVKKALLAAKLPFGACKAQPMQLDVYDFKHDKKDFNVYWDVRKGLIPIVGGARETGGSCFQRITPSRFGTQATARL